MLMKDEDYYDIRQLMDIALKNFPLKEEKEKYVTMFFKDHCNVTIGSNYGYNSSIGSSAHLPFEIQFDGDDDFEQVLPKSVNWTNSVDSDCSFYFKPLKNISDIACRFNQLYTKPKSVLSSKTKTKTKGIWARLKTFFKGKEFCSKRQQKEFKTTNEMVTADVINYLLEEKYLQKNVKEGLNLLQGNDGRFDVNLWL